MNTEMIFILGIESSCDDTAASVICDGKILRYNRYMEELSGYSLSEMSGKDWFSTFLPNKEILKTVFD